MDRAAMGWAAMSLAALALLLAACSECDSDADCQAGQVCEAVPGADSGSKNQCVAGCHDDSQCGAGQSCEPVTCIQAPCPGQCVGGPPPCEGDGDCGAGSVCELSTSCEAPSQCVPGCHEDSQCGAGERCRIVQCVTCPCPGFCEPHPGACGSDSECGAGSVCELSAGCQLPMQCVPGCRDDDACPGGQRCIQPQCVTCPCPGFCAE